MGRHRTAGPVGHHRAALTTQYLQEAERLADRIAILHQGRIIVEGTLAELNRLFPPATREYVVRQPSLEEIFLAIVGDHPTEPPTEPTPEPPTEGTPR